MAMPAERWISPQEYLELEDASETRHEYFNGRIYAMAGGTLEHARIVGNIFSALHIQLQGQKCEVLMENIRIKVQRSDFYTYPDLLVVCGPKLEAGKSATLLNPEVIIEVLSESTQGYDRGDKFLYYQQLETLKEYVLVSQNKPLVERFVRRGNEWVYSNVTGLDEITALDAVSVTLPMAAIYDRIEFPENTPGAGNET